VGRGIAGSGATVTTFSHFPQKKIAAGALPN
jgi:hypothetical protein